MHASMKKITKGDLVIYTCNEIAVPHAFTTKFGGVSQGDYASLNFRFSCADDAANVRQNYRILAQACGVEYRRMTLTKQVHKAQVETLTAETVGTGLHQPFNWEADALVTTLRDTPLLGFYADCVVTLLHDPVGGGVAVCHSGWRGTAMKILQNTVAQMERDLGAKRENIVAVLGPSICQDCFETDADVPDAMRASMGDMVDEFIVTKGAKYHIDLQGINVRLLEQAGLHKIINSDICTMCHHEEFWSHRITGDARGVQVGMICRK